MNGKSLTTKRSLESGIKGHEAPVIGQDAGGGLFPIKNFYGRP